MIITRPEVFPEGLYSQGQAAKALQVDRHTVARYAEAGLIKFRVRKAGKRLVTTGTEIIKCWKQTYL
ncbi:hypothetical protein [uncultured Prevotella sp.]|uniref:hypothetical protein n=1 Tax=uncultured Prevotella sp. TaxID=159272 RepID=UPI0026021835|nr:hypothetical protein [uncultured Prevotella sp.]